MAGLIKKMTDSIIAQKAKGNDTIAKLTKAKLTLKGVNPDKYTFISADDPVVIDKLRAIGKEMGVSI